MIHKATFAVIPLILGILVMAGCLGGDTSTITVTSATSYSPMSSYLSSSPSPTIPADAIRSYAIKVIVWRYN